MIFKLILLFESKKQVILCRYLFLINLHLVSIILGLVEFIDAIELSFRFFH